MSHSTSNQILLLSVMFVTLTSCSKLVKHSAQNAAPTTFASPSEAGAALLAASQSGDRSAFLAIFGPDGGEALFTGDAAHDAANLRGFVGAYTRMNRWEKVKAGGEVLYIGADNTAFPVPLGQNPSGRWYFDTAAGKDEILARRIGKNELTAIAACEAMADAQKQYFSQTHERSSAPHAGVRNISLADAAREAGQIEPFAALEILGHGNAQIGPASALWFHLEPVDARQICRAHPKFLGVGTDLLNRRRPLGVENRRDR